MKIYKESTTTTHTHFGVSSYEKGVSENEAPGPVGAYTTPHNSTPTTVPDRTFRVSILYVAREQGAVECRPSSSQYNTHAPTGPWKSILV